MPGLSIRSLLVGLFALMALIVGGEGMLAINKIAAVNASVTDLANNWLPSVDVVRRINAIAEQYRVYQARHVMAASDAEMAAQEAAIARTAEALEAARKRYESLISSDEERRSYTLFGSHLALYQQSVPELIKLSRANRKAEASALYIGELSRKFTDVRNELGKLVELNDKGAREADRRGRRQLRRGARADLRHARRRHRDRDRRDGVQLRRHRAPDRPHHAGDGRARGRRHRGGDSVRGARATRSARWRRRCRCSRTT